MCMKTPAHATPAATSQAVASNSLRAVGDVHLPKLDVVCALTTAPVSHGTLGDVLPEFLEVPDVPRVFGLRRTTLYGLMKDGEIKSILLRRPGCQTGKRLVVAASVRDYLRRELEKQGGDYAPGVCNARRSKSRTRG